MSRQSARATLLAVLTALTVVPPNDAPAFPPPVQGTGVGTRDDPYLVPRTAAGVAVDGAADEAAWDRALVLELPYETSPGENVPAQVKTQGLLLYDDSNLYVAFRCHDPNPDAVRAFLRDRDSGWYDDRAVVVLDTFNDERRSIVFGVTALGVQQDYYEDSAGESDIGWDTIWDSATRIHEWGWTAEMAIPFRSVSFQRREGPQMWGLVLSRKYPRSLEYWFSSVPADKNNDCSLCLAAKIVGFEGAAPGRNIEVAPTLTGVRTEERESMPDGSFRNRNEDTEAGLTVRWGLTPNLTMSGTLNPDFSQVEADALQLDINEPFALSYEERRPFFTEGMDFFDTNLEAVYTRTLRDPQWGVKLTGKEGGHTIGAYVVRDELTNLIFPGSQSSASTSLPIESTASVLRYKRDLGRRATLGLLATDREADGYFSRLAGVDGDVRVTQRDRIRVQVLGSSTEYPEATASAFGQEPDPFEGWALDAGFRHSSRNLHGWVNYRDLGENFRADVGIMPQVDYRQVETGVSARWWGGTGKPYSVLELAAGFEEAEDHAGGFLWRSHRAAFTYGGPLQSMFYLHGERKREAFAGRGFDQDFLMSIASMRPSADVSFSLTAYVGDRIDYSNARLGQGVSLEPEVDWNIGRHLRLGWEGQIETLDVAGRDLFTAHTNRLSLFYHFNARCFVRGIFQYTSLDRNVDAYTYPVDPESDSLLTQFLFSYTINPRTVLFLGYRDNHLATPEYDLTQSDRTVFAKVGYALRT